MFALWYLSLAIDEYRRSPLFKTDSTATNGKSIDVQKPVVLPTEKENLEEKKPQTPKIEPKKIIDIVPPKTPTPSNIEKQDPEPAKDPFDAKLNEIANKQQPKLPAKDPFDEKLAELSSIVAPKNEVKTPEFTKTPLPISPAKSDIENQAKVQTPKTPPTTPLKDPFDEKFNELSKKPQVTPTQDPFDVKLAEQSSIKASQILKDPFEAKLAEFSSDFDTPADFDAPISSSSFKQFQDPFDQNLTEPSSQINKSTNSQDSLLSNIDTLQEDPLDRKLRELSTKYNEKLESTKNIKLSDAETTFENLTRQS